MDRLNWDDLRVFLALHREGTVRKAAAFLSVSHPTVARRLATMERQMGVRLFDRLPEGYALNAAGEAVLVHAEQVEQEIYDLERRIVGGDARLSGAIKLTMPPPMAPLLMPALADFHGRYPQIDLEIVTSYEVIDLAKRDADIAIRFFQEPEPWLVGRRLPQFANAAYATKQYIQAHTFYGPDATARWIGWRGDGAQPDWVQRTDFPDCRAVWQVNDPIAQQEAARAELGMALLPCWIGDRDPGLTRVPPGRVGNLRQAWILTHPDLRSSARIREMVSFLAASFEELAPILRGAEQSSD